MQYMLPKKIGTSHVFGGYEDLKKLSDFEAQ